MEFSSLDFCACCNHSLDLLLGELTGFCSNVVQIWPLGVLVLVPWEVFWCFQCHCSCLALGNLTETQ